MAVMAVSGAIAVAMLGHKADLAFMALGPDWRELRQQVGGFNLSPMVGLFTAGYSAVLLGLFYLVVDLWQKRVWCQPFVWYGMNAITVYLADNLLGFRRIASRLFGTDVKAFFDAHVTNGFGDLVISFGEIGIGLWLVWFLYQRRIFLRL